MQSAITPRPVGLDNKIANKRAKRYIFYPTSPLDMSGTQATSPVWKPKIPRSRIVLLEPLEYMTQAGDEVQVYEAGGVKLELAEMGTDAQVKFLLDTYGEKGLVDIASLTNVSPDIAVEIEKLIYPDGVVPDTLVKLQDHFNSLSSILNPEDALQEQAIRVISEILRGVDTAISWANSYCNMIEKEIQSSRAGRAGRPSMTSVDRYYYKQIGRAMPRDNDLNFGGQEQGLATALQGMLSNAISPVELDAMKERMAKQDEMITALIAQNQAFMDTQEVKKK